MDEPFLIAHRVRGEAAFDVAIKQPCAICLGSGKRQDEDQLVCEECDGEGHWWIISTSGHRAYPWWAVELSGLYLGYIDKPTTAIPDIKWDNIPTENYPDHYPINASPHAKVADIGKSILAKLGLGRSAAPIKRRI